MLGYARIILESIWGHDKILFRSFGHHLVIIWRHYKSSEKTYVYIIFSYDIYVYHMDILFIEHIHITAACNKPNQHALKINRANA